MPDATLLSLAGDVLTRARLTGTHIATAESCTGGLIAATLTEIAGSSDVVDRGFVTYSNQAKTDMLGVPVSVIEKHGAVSRETAIAMAEGALRAAHVGCAVSCTGIAGPGGGSDPKPVGLVHIAVARTGKDTQHRECRFGDIGRPNVRMKTVEEALQFLLAAL